MMHKILKLSMVFVLAFNGWGCSLIVLEDFDPRGSEVSVKGFYLINDEIPTEEFCEEHQIENVRLEFYSRSSMMRHPELEFPCADNLFNKGPVLQHGYYTVRWVAYDSSGSKIGAGPFFYLDALEKETDREHQIIKLPAGRIYLDENTFNPFGEEITFNIGWMINGDSLLLQQRCKELGIANIEISFFRPDAILLSDRRVVGVASCERGTYSMMRPSLKKGRYQFTVRALSVDGAVRFESLPELFEGGADNTSVDYVGAGPINITGQLLAQNLVLFPLWQSAENEASYDLCSSGLVTDFRYEVVHRRTGNVIEIGQSDCQNDEMTIHGLTSDESFDFVFYGQSKEDPTHYWESVCGDISIGQEQLDPIECEISYRRQD